MSSISQRTPGIQHYNFANARNLSRSPATATAPMFGASTVIATPNAGNKKLFLLDLSSKEEFAKDIAEAKFLDTSKAVFVLMETNSDGSKRMMAVNAQELSRFIANETGTVAGETISYNLATSNSLPDLWDEALDGNTSNRKIRMLDRLAKQIPTRPLETVPNGSETELLGQAKNIVGQSTIPDLAPSAEVLRANLGVIPSEDKPVRRRLIHLTGSPDLIVESLYSFVPGVGEILSGGRFARTGEKKSNSPWASFSRDSFAGSGTLNRARERFIGLSDEDKNVRNRLVITRQIPKFDEQDQIVDSVGDLEAIEITPSQFAKAIASLIDIANRKAISSTVQLTENVANMFIALGRGDLPTMIDGFTEVLEKAGSIANGQQLMVEFTNALFLACVEAKINEESATYLAPDREDYLNNVMFYEGPVGEDASAPNVDPKNAVELSKVDDLESLTFDNLWATIQENASLNKWNASALESMRHIQKLRRERQSGTN